MHIFPTCTTCGFPIGDVAGCFQAARAALVAEKLREADVDPAYVAVASLQIECRELLDSLGVFGACCRIHLTTGMEFHEVR